MKINANSIKKGNVLQYNGKLCVVTKTPDWAMPGKGGAFVQVEMRDIKEGKKISTRFRSNEDIEKVRLEQKKYQYLYKESDKLVLMDLGNYEQIQVEASILAERIGFLEDNMNVIVESYNDEPLSIELPDTIVALVDQADAVIKGQTATSSYKPAILENGLRIMVPQFIENGDKIVVKTEDCSYVERFKE